jgi:hypothetical protein
VFLDGGIDVTPSSSWPEVTAADRTKPSGLAALSAALPTVE